MQRVFTVFLLLFCFTAFAQQETSGKKFQSINLLGIMEGEAGTGFQIQTINGIKLNKNFIGVGVGLDYYFMRSIPLFIDLRREMLASRKAFVYADGGINFPWQDQSFDWEIKSSSGLFYELGIGYRIPLKGCSFLMSGGYSYKRFDQKESYPIYCLLPPCPEQVYYYKHELRRISVKMGISF